MFRFEMGESDPGAWVVQLLQYNRLHVEVITDHPVDPPVDANDSLETPILRVMDQNNIAPNELFPIQTPSIRNIVSMTHTGSDDFDRVRSDLGASSWQPVEEPELVIHNDTGLHTSQVVHSLAWLYYQSSPLLRGRGSSDQGT
jgi:hypothetical protein